MRNERKPVTVEQIAKEAGMSQLLAGEFPYSPGRRGSRTQKLNASAERILRYMAEMGMASQASDDSFAASKNTEALEMPSIRAGVGFG